MDKIKTTKDLDILEEMLLAYERTHSAGGCLHIVIEDGNWDKSSIEFCVQFSRENGDEFGEVIARQLLEMPAKAMEIADISLASAFSEWRSVIEARVAG